MKKLFFFLSVAVLGVAAASCQKELVVENGAKGNVTFTIQTPDAGTKAIADGTNVDVVYYEVYKAGSGHANSIEGGSPLIDSEIENFNGTATLKLNLLQNQDYVVLFWAEVAGKSYYTTTDLRKVTVDYTGLKANDEARAAFCQKLEFNSSKTYSAKVTLVRPFAQINLGTTADSINPAINGYDLDIVSSYMKVVGAATEFSVASMTTGSETTTVEFAADTVPHDFTPDSEVLTVNDVNYAYLGMNYILAAADAATVDVTYEVNTNVGSISRQIPAVPVKKNFRTNLLGNLLTQETTIDIVVDEKFNTPDQEPAPIYMAAANGGEFTLTEDVELSEPLKIQAPLVLDLNGYTITAGLKQEGRHHYAIDNYAHLTLVGSGAINARGVQNFGTMVIDGDITITNVDTNGGSAIWNEGEVTINKGTFTTNNEAGAGSYGAALNTRPGGTATVNGGNFSAYSQLTYAIVNEGTTTINNATVTGKHGAVAGAESNDRTTINGGTFSLMENPGLSDHCVYCVSDIKGGTFTLGNNNDSGAQVFYESTIAEGYKATKVGDNYIVTEDNVAVTADVEKVKEVFANGGSILLTDDIAFEKIVSIEPGKEVYMNLNGKTITVDENTTSNTLFYVKDGGKLVIDGNGIVDLGAVSTMAVFAPYGELVIENGTFIRNKVETVTNKTTGLFMGAKTTASNVTIKGGYFDAGYYNTDAADIEEILAGTKEFEETADDITKRGDSKDANKVRVALKENTSVLLNHSGYGIFKIYGGTFVGANPAWGDEGCMLPTTPNYLRPWSYYQGALLDGQEFNENGIVLPEGYTIKKGATAEGVPTYTVTYNK